MREADARCRCLRPMPKPGRAVTGIEAEVGRPKNFVLIFHGVNWPHHPPFSLSIFFLPSIVSEPPSPPPRPRLPSSLFLFTSTTAVALPNFPIATNHPTTLSLRTTAMAAFSAHNFSSYRIHHPLSSYSYPPLATSPALSFSFIVNHCQLVPPWLNLWCCRRRVSDLSFLLVFLRCLTTHFFCLRFLLCDVVDVILIVVALLCYGDAFPPPSSSSLSPSAPAPLCHHRRDQITTAPSPHLPPLPQLPRKHRRYRIPSPLWLPFLRPLAAAMIGDGHRQWKEEIPSSWQGTNNQIFNSKKKHKANKN